MNYHARRDRHALAPGPSPVLRGVACDGRPRPFKEVHEMVTCAARAVNPEISEENAVFRYGL